MVSARGASITATRGLDFPPVSSSRFWRELTKELSAWQSDGPLFSEMTRSLSSSCRDCQPQRLSSMASHPSKGDKGDKGKGKNIMKGLRDSKVRGKTS
jgi:hypothetical protein